MYLAYKIDEDCGQSYIEPIGILKDDLDLKNLKIYQMIEKSNMKKLI